MKTENHVIKKSLRHGVGVMIFGKTERFCSLLKKSNGKKMKNKQTLAQFIYETRENAGYSLSGLAKRANLPVELLEDIESGRELFLSTPVRQKLSNALKITSAKIKAFEKVVKSSDKDFVLSDMIEDLKFKILYEGLTGHACPVCSSPLVCRVVVMYDLENNAIKHPKAYCSKCPFQIK